RQVHVASLNGASWQLVGGALYAAPNKDDIRPSIANVGGVPYVAWQEYDGTYTRVYVASFNGTSWQLVGAALNVNSTKTAAAPTIADVGGVPYVAWQEADGTNYEVYVASFNGTSWHLVGGAALNVNTTKDAITPSIANIGGVPYVAWREVNASNIEQVY